MENRKTKSKKWICSEVSVNTQQSGGIHVVSPEEDVEGYGGKDLQKGKVFKPGMRVRG